MTEQMNADWANFTPDPNDWTDDYAEAAAPTGRFTPPRGNYYLRLPDSIPDEAFGPTRDGKGLQITLDPLAIVSGPLDAPNPDAEGQTMRFVRVNTKKITGTNESSAGGVLRNFGMTVEEVSALHRIADKNEFVAAWRNAFQSLSGQTTPNPVYCDWDGRDKGVQGNEAFYRGMGPGRGVRRFDQPDPEREGQYLPYVELDRDEPDPRTPGATRKARVWANLTPTLRGFAPRT